MNRIGAPLLLALLASAAGACTHQPDGHPSATIQTPASDALFGRRARITYPQFVAEVDYISPSALHWKTTATDGAVAEGDETPTYKRLSESQHFISWIERDGFTVSQVIDTKQLRVVTFGSYLDEKSPRGRRAGALLEGTIAFAP